MTPRQVDELTARLRTSIEALLTAKTGEEVQQAAAPVA
jgi:hypothetical protein